MFRWYFIPRARSRGIGLSLSVDKAISDYFMPLWACACTVWYSKRRTTLNLGEIPVLIILSPCYLLARIMTPISVVKMLMRSTRYNKASSLDMEWVALFHFRTFSITQHQYLYKDIYMWADSPTDGPSDVVVNAFLIVLELDYPRHINFSK